MENVSFYSLDQMPQWKKIINSKDWVKQPASFDPLIIFHDHISCLNIESRNISPQNVEDKAIVLVIFFFFQSSHKDNR